MRRTLLVLALVSTLAAPALAGELAGVTLPDTAKAGDKDLVLNGLGLRKKLFIKIYVGGLYLAAKERDAAKILAGDTPRRIVMHFLYGVSPGQMCDAWDEGLTQNTPNASAEVKTAFKTLCSYMEDIPKGNELVLTYVPGQGTAVEVNGKSKGTLAGKDVADALVSTWIGPDPGPGTDFKNAVLGQ